MSALAVVPIPLIALAIAVATAIALIIAVVRPSMFHRPTTTDRSQPLATLPERIDRRHYLEKEYGRLLDPKGSPVDVLFTEAKAAYDANRERLKVLESKAGTLIGIVTTGFGAIALLGDPSKTPKSGWWLTIALLALAIAFTTALWSLRPGTSDVPSLSHYLLVETVANPSNAPRIKFDLAVAWVRDARQLEQKGFAKSRLVLISTAALGIGIGALAANYATATGGEKPSPTIRVILAPDTSPSP